MVILVLNVLLCLICLFKSVLGPWQGLQNPRGVPHRLHGHRPVRHHLHSRGFLPLSRRPEERKGNLHSRSLWEFCVYVVAYCRHYFIKELNKGLYYTVCSKCVVMFCPLDLIILLRKRRGHRTQQRVQSACKCDPVYFTLGNNNRRPKLDASYMLCLYVTCLTVLWRDHSLITSLCPQCSQCVFVRLFTAGLRSCLCVCEWIQAPHRASGPTSQELHCPLTAFVVQAG